MESWQKVWREAIVPLLSDEALEALQKGLLDNDVRLTQGMTTMPPPLASMQDWPVDAACALAYCGWQGEGLETVAEVDEYFSRMCFEIDNRMGEPGACRGFLNWYDEAPREQMRRELLEEVNLALEGRQVCDRCSQVLDRGCDGRRRCPDCDGPCPGCHDG